MKYEVEGVRRKLYRDLQLGMMMHSGACPSIYQGLVTLSFATGKGIDLPGPDPTGGSWRKVVVGFHLESRVFPIGSISQAIHGVLEPFTAEGWDHSTRSTMGYVILPRRSWANIAGERVSKREEMSFSVGAAERVETATIKAQISVPGTSEVTRPVTERRRRSPSGPSHQPCRMVREMALK